MRHHAYFYAGDSERGIEAALTFGENSLRLSRDSNPDIITLRYQTFPVEEARGVSEIVSRVPLAGDTKLVIISATRLFHETQNALLKTFEEPAAGTYLVLIVPSEGNIIPTLRSRLLPLPIGKEGSITSELGKEFIEGTAKDREKIIAKILDRAKSDAAEEKQAARIDALRLAEDIARAAHKMNTKKADQALQTLLSDLTRLIPILHERSAPLKPILEHISLVVSASPKI